MRRDQLRLLIINSYAGSITQAAVSTGLEVIGSYENGGYGLDIQAANFPKLRYVADLADWPIQDLRNVIVAAHPPCSPFCSQSAGQRNKKNRGVSAPAFTCTTNILRYALAQRCAALAVESVMGAYEGAAPIHEGYAQTYGYNLYRVLQNSITFGVPQWRQRFWAFFVRRDLGKRLLLYHRPNYKTIAQLLAEEPATGPAPTGAQKSFDRQISTARANGVPRAALNHALNDGKEYGPLFKILARQYPKAVGDRTPNAVARELFEITFFSNTISVLDPKGYTGTLIAQCTWYAMGRLLTMRDCKAVMGFPRDYIFPGRTESDLMSYLSRGVCPPIARWVFGTLIDNITGEFPVNRGYTIDLVPNEVANLRPKRKAIRSNDAQLKLFEED